MSKILKAKQFLFNNTSDKQTIAKNSFWLFISETFSRGIMFLFTIIFARYLGIEGYGKLSFAMSFTALFAVIADLGIPFLTVRGIANDNGTAKKYLINGTILKLALSLISFIFIALSVGFIKTSTESKFLFYFFGIYILIVSFNEFYRSFFRGFEKIEYEAFSKVIEGLTLLIGGLVLVRLKYDIIFIPGIYILSALLSLIFTLIIIKKKFIFFGDSFDFYFLKRLAIEGFVYGLVVFLSFINFNSDVVILGIFRSDFEVGGYSAIYKILMLLIIATSFIFIPIFPFLSKNNQDNKKLLNIVRSIYKFIVPLGISVALIVLLLKNFIVQILYGAGYTNFTYLISILIIVFLLILFREPASYTLLAIGRQSIILKILLVSASLNIILNLMFIPKYGVIAAALTTLFSEFINFVFLNLFLFKTLKRNVLS